MENNVEPKRKMTDEERLVLATKLDKELDEFISGLGKQKYTDGWPEDRWQEEMEKHPFFMKQAPKPGDEVHPLFEGLQKLKYDPEENTTEELALNYKEDGLFYFKHKKFRTSIYSFTEGLKVNCNNPEINATLYNNRSAAHYFIGNYRSSLLDAQKCLQIKPDYNKPRWRAAQCAFEIKQFDYCVALCDDILEFDLSNEAAKSLRNKARNTKLEKERDDRKQAVAAKKKLDEFHNLVDALKSRGVKFDDQKPNSGISENLLQPKFLPLENFPVHIDSDGTMIWPAAFSYPEFLFSDFQQQLNENARMEDVIYSMLESPLPCDKKGQYRPGNVCVYFENRKAASVCKVDQSMTIGDIVAAKDFFVSGGALLFYIVPNGSNAEEEFVNQKRRPLTYP